MRAPSGRPGIEDPISGTVPRIAGMLWLTAHSGSLPGSEVRRLFTGPLMPRVVVVP